MAEPKGLRQVRLKLPASPQDIAALQLGSVVYLDGVVYTAREGVYERVLVRGEPLPEGLCEISNANFHCSPAAALEPDGSYAIGGVTATASFRFSKYMAEWLDRTGTKIVIGKAGMPREDYQKVLSPRGAVYLTTVGYGTGALLGRGVKRVREVHWLEELGIAQAMWMFEVENFGPFIVDSDLAGNSLFAQQGDLVNERIARLYDGLKPPALHRYGETDDRKREVM
ncbi:fumarate hydratase C-terminal domain-containing protein [Afifella pfennigii]|uniref:fumarate hydratase C-terminal domain-containing protein n=1 Tax=Afifella pfennigii TaxID=209897 RepID=UPI00047BD636|nr:fumarate hydratase C-terminal domain-containing protein [Afifella pfennigii]